MNTRLKQFLAAENISYNQGRTSQRFSCSCWKKQSEL